MRNILILSCLILSATFSFAQGTIILLYKGAAPGSESWNWDEAIDTNNQFHSLNVYNVSKPSLMAFLPTKGTANGTAVIICPGGAFHTLSIENEGTNVAKQLSSRGVTAFVLKYRLVKCETNDPASEVVPLILHNPQKLDTINATVVPLAIQDGLTAIKYLREHAAEFGIDKHRIGIMGFSAGGTITLGATLSSTPESRPDFIAPIYPYTKSVDLTNIPKDLPPLFVAAASDDQLGLAPLCTTLYGKWIASGNIAELHIYSKGGHGFGMKKQNLPVDTWYERFEDWLTLLGYMTMK